jgi:protein-S-isoprenylcysteine O-methyltransferase Ste14
MLGFFSCVDLHFVPKTNKKTHAAQKDTVGQKGIHSMNIDISFHNLWLFYAIAYAVAFPMQMWANNKRGAPFDDPDFLFRGKKIFTIAMIWLFGGFIISLFVPVEFRILFYLGLFFYLGGMIIVGFTFYSFAHNRGLVTTGIHRYSRNPGYVGWTVVIFGLCLMGWSSSFWSILFLIYFIITPPYFHWTVLLEEEFLANKYGDSYRAYVKSASRYLGVPKGGPGS